MKYGKIFYCHLKIFMYEATILSERFHRQQLRQLVWLNLGVHLKKTDAFNFFF